MTRTGRGLFGLALLMLGACRDGRALGARDDDPLAARPLSSLTPAEVDAACAAARSRAGTAGQQTVRDGVCTMLGLRAAAAAGDGAAAACQAAVDRCHDQTPRDLDCKLAAMDLTACAATVAQSQACETTMLAEIAKLVDGNACAGLDAAGAATRLEAFSKLNRLPVCAPLMACSRR